MYDQNFNGEEAGAGAGAGAGAVTHFVSPPSHEQFLPLPYFKMFLETFLNEIMIVHYSLYLLEIPNSL